MGFIAHCKCFYCCIALRCASILQTTMTSKQWTVNAMVILKFVQQILNLGMNAEMLQNVMVSIPADDGKAVMLKQEFLKMIHKASRRIRRRYIWLKWKWHQKGDTVMLHSFAILSIWALSFIFFYYILPSI